MQARNIMRLSSSLAALAVGLGAAAAANAQTPPGTPDSSSRTAQSQAPEEIIVTAQRREERLQSVPIAITALPAQTLQNQGITNIEQIGQLAPSLSIVPYANSTDTLMLNIRGQGIADAGQITKDGGVGLYVDGFYIARPQAALFDIGEPERVEVLRGPQGTLYGRNTTGGAINLVTKKPTTDAFDGDVQLTYGSRNYARVVAAINVPITDELAVRANLSYVNKDGYVQNPGADHNYAEFGQLAGRIAARWTPTPDLTVDYAFDGGNVTSTQPYYSDPDLDVVPGYFANPDRTYAPLSIPTSSAVFTDHQLTIDWAASDDVTLKSLSGYRGFDGKQYANYGISLSTPFFPVSTAQYHHYVTQQYTQEFQIIGSLGEQLTYTGGLYYFHENGNHLQVQDVGLIPLGISETGNRRVNASSTSSAAYLQATWTPPVLDDRLKLTVGGRYTRDARGATRNSDTDGIPIDVNVSNKQSFYNFSPMVNLAMQWTSEIMSYAKFSKGYKAGGSSEAGPDFRNTYGPEKVTSYEVGLKSQFLDQLLTFNAALFRNDFDHLQLDFLTSPADPSIVATFNAGAARVDGYELEAGLRPTEDVSLHVAYTELFPKMLSVSAPAGTLFDPAYNPASPFDVGEDVTSYFSLPFVPKHSISVFGDWTMLHFGDDAIAAHAGYSFQSSIYITSTTGPSVAGRDLARSQPLSMLDARLTWTHPLNDHDKLALSVFGTNLLDRRTNQFVIPLGSPLTGYTDRAQAYSEPRTIGVEARLNF